MDAHIKAMQDYNSAMNGGTPTSVHGELARYNRQQASYARSSSSRTSAPARSATPGQEPGTRVDPETGVIQRKSFFGGWKDTNTRIEPATGAIERNGLFGWRDTGERIDPATGKHQRRGWFGWNDV